MNTATLNNKTAGAFTPRTAALILTCLLLMLLPCYEVFAHEGQHEEGVWHYRTIEPDGRGGLMVVRYHRFDAPDDPCTTHRNTLMRKLEGAARAVSDKYDELARENPAPLLGGGIANAPHHFGSDNSDTLNGLADDYKKIQGYLNEARAEPCSGLPALAERLGLAEDSASDTAYEQALADGRSEEGAAHEAYEQVWKEKLDNAGSLSERAQLLKEIRNDMRDKFSPAQMRNLEQAIATTDQTIAQAREAGVDPRSLPANHSFYKEPKPSPANSGQATGKANEGKSATPQQKDALHDLEKAKDYVEKLPPKEDSPVQQGPLENDLTDIFDAADTTTNKHNGSDKPNTKGDHFEQLLGGDPPDPDTHAPADGQAGEAAQQHERDVYEKTPLITGIDQRISKLEERTRTAKSEELYQLEIESFQSQAEFLGWYADKTELFVDPDSLPRSEEGYSNLDRLLDNVGFEDKLFVGPGKDGVGGKGLQPGDPGAGAAATIALGTRGNLAKLDRDNSAALVHDKLLRLSGHEWHEFNQPGVQQAHQYLADHAENAALKRVFSDFADPKPTALKTAVTGYVKAEEKVGKVLTINVWDYLLGDKPGK